jgi:hypothetical protein
MFKLKKLIIASGSLFSLFIYTASARADSPLTNCDIYPAYMDIPMVRQAKAQEKIDLKIAEFLASPKNPVDVKIAVVNALGWQFEGKYNSTMYLYYLTFIHKMKAESLNSNNLSPDEMLTLGYMNAMDDYFHPENAVPILEKAAGKNNKSFTYAIILAITKAQTEFSNVNSWPKMWELTGNVLNDKKLKPDMRKAAVKSIRDYMILYKKN